MNTKIAPKSIDFLNMSECSSDVGHVTVAVFIEDLQTYQLTFWSNPGDIC